MTKVTDTKSTSRAAQHQKQPGNAFFGKESSSSFFGETETADSPFFVQRKLTVGKADDHYEKRADQVSDKVVQ
ncbi:MAG TPA: hypothetical protein VM802_07800, partial [Chitinophaga sp.]|uniref:hypothetical protein n=1 Tax=Chitinophaga sp. TaxID=1869181 RepID=UPI002D1508EB